jgi:hypothetical protein
VATIKNSKKFRVGQRVRASVKIDGVAGRTGVVIQPFSVEARMDQRDRVEVLWDGYSKPDRWVDESASWIDLADVEASS